jgi:hypothetical protein
VLPEFFPNEHRVRAHSLAEPTRHD